MLFQILGSALAILAFGVINETPKKYLWCCAVMGAISGGVYLLVVGVNQNEIFAYFLSALVVTIVSHGASKILKVPTLVFLVAGILPTVPGSSLYRSVYYIINRADNLAINYFIETLAIAGVIALAIFAGESIYKAINMWK